MSQELTLHLSGRLRYSLIMRNNKATLRAGGTGKLAEFPNPAKSYQRVQLLRPNSIDFSGKFLVIYISLNRA